MPAAPRRHLKTAKSENINKVKRLNKASDRVTTDSSTDLPETVERRCWDVLTVASMPT